MVPSRTLRLLPCLPLVLAANLVAVPESMVAKGHRTATRSAIDSSTATWTITRRVRGSRFGATLPPSVKIHGLSNKGHDNALKLLERYSASFFFELDVCYDLAFSLRRREQRSSLAMRRRRRLVAGEPSPIRTIRNAYAENAVTLYCYGRSARGLPLLQYLAYYQAIEYFYPSFSNAEIMRRTRT